MTLHTSSFFVALALVHGLSACSSAAPPASDNSLVNVESVSAPEILPVSANPPVEPIKSKIETAAGPIQEQKPSVEPTEKQGRIDERFFRPMLATDDPDAKHLEDLLPDGAKVGYLLMDVQRGTPIQQHRADSVHIPASSAKLTTAVAALDLLGPKHRFRTELRATGPIEDGVLKGDLILQGGGDPVLDLPDLLPLIEQLARQPLRRIEGRFLIDDTLLPRLTEIEPTQPTEAAYNPGLGALSIAFNRVNLRWRSRPALSIETVPHLDEASFETVNAKRLPPGGVQLKAFDGEDVVWQLANNGSRRSKRSLPVKDPGLYAGRIFSGLAGLHGIDLPEPQRLMKRPESRLLAVHESRSLKDLVRDMLWYSNNLVAELIGLAAAKTLKPDLADLETSAGILLSELQRQLPNTSWENAGIDNHSGLSSKARFSPEQLTAILNHGWHQGMLSSLLPGSGWSGTLARRFNSEDQALRVWAKTGSINYVATLGGFVLSSTHSPAAFVVMISDEKARAAYDSQKRRTKASEKKAQAWKKKAEKAMNTIIEGWLEPPAGRPSGSLHAHSR